MFYSSTEPTDDILYAPFLLSVFAFEGVGVAIQIGFGNFGSAITAGVYRTKDAPHYVLGRKYRDAIPFPALSSFPLRILS